MTPIVAKITLDDLAETGTVVGGLSATGTAGAIFGTFLTGFVLLAALPSRPIVLAVGVALVIAGTDPRRPLRASSGLPGVAAVVAATLVGSALLGIVSAALPVRDRLLLRPGHRRRAPRQRPGAVAGHPAPLVRRPARPQPTSTSATPGWWRTPCSPPHPDGPLDALYIGGGGFTLPRWLSAERPGSTNTVLELDPAWSTSPRTSSGWYAGEIDEIAIGDARLGIDDTPEGGFDLVVGDAFGGLSVPWHLTTREFVEDIDSRLAPDGVYVMNLIDYPPFRFARAEAATLAEVFPEVRGAGPARLPRRQSRRQHRARRRARSPSTSPPSRPPSPTGPAPRWRSPAPRPTEWIDGSPILTDDFAPVDQWISRG